MVDIEIDDRHPLQPARLQHTHGDGHIIERTEALAVVRKRVV